MKFNLFIVLLLAVLTASCGSDQKPGQRVSELDNRDSISSNDILIPYEPRDGHEYVTVAFNGVPMTMCWDTGCTTTTISLNDFYRMVKEGKITDASYNDTKYAQIADGSFIETFEYYVSTATFNTVNGKQLVIHDVNILVAPYANASNLLGKNIIDQLDGYRRDDSQTCFVVRR